MTVVARTYVTLRSLIRWLLPAMGTVAVWPLLWLDLQSGGGAVLLAYFLMLTTMGPVALQLEGVVRGRKGWPLHLFHGSTGLVRFLTVVLLYLFSFRCLCSLTYFGRDGSFLSEGALLGVHSFVYGFFLMLSRKRGVLDYLSLFVWLLLVILVTSLLIYDFQLPVFPEAFQSYVYPRWEGLGLSDLISLFGLCLFTMGAGWGLRPGRSSSLWPYHYGLWAFVWVFTVGLLTVPFVFKLNFATSSFETLLFHLPMVFRHLPAGVFAGKSLLLVFYLGSFYVSLLILSRGDLKGGRKGGHKVLALLILLSCGIWLWGAPVNFDLGFRILVTRVYPVYAVLLLISWLAGGKPNLGRRVPFGNQAS